MFSCNNTAINILMQKGRKPFWIISLEIHGLKRIGFFISVILFPSFANFYYFIMKVMHVCFIRI